ncbi:MAG: glycosyltransferase family 2 protein [bacterium]
MNDLISVIIPAYNHEKFVEYTINSIILQSFKNIELIIINDGSTDSTNDKITNLADKCKERFVRYEHFNRENLGYIKTLNQLIETANGKYIYLIASDDIAKPDALETLYNFIKNKPKYGMVVGNNEIIDENNQVVYWDKQRNIVKTLEEAEYKNFVEFLKNDRPDIDFNSNNFGSYKSLTRGNYIPNGYIMRKEAIIKAGGYKENTLDDWYLNLQIAKHYKIKFINKVLFSYRWHSTNTMKNTEFIDKLVKNVQKEINEEKNLYQNTVRFKIISSLIKMLFIFIPSKKIRNQIRLQYL